ncbi:MAG: hypothetical protein ACI8ZM_000358 [Crocinitomix sp.]|jgi:hypothetical protein
MRALNIIGIIVSIGIFRYGAYINNQLQDLMWSLNGYYGYEELQAGMKNLGMNGAFFMILLGLFFLVLYIANIKNINRQTVKVLSIVGIVASILFVLMNVGYIGSGSSHSLPFMYIMWWFFGLVCLAFSVVLLLQAVRDYREANSPVVARTDDDVIDDFDVE